MQIQMGSYMFSANIQNLPRLLSNKHYTIHFVERVSRATALFKIYIYQNALHSTELYRITIFTDNVIENTYVNSMCWYV